MNLNYSIGPIQDTEIFENQSKPLNVINVDGLSSKENKRNAFRHWRACIFSGRFVRIEVIEKVPVSMGYCNQVKRWINFEIECSTCKKHKMTRTPPKHERTATRKARIGTARRRSIARKKEHFETSWKGPGKRKN